MAKKQYLKTLNQLVENGRTNNLIQNTVENETIDGKRIIINGNEMVNFGSCSYLGLETDQRLREAAGKAAMAYGTQFSSSKTYAAIKLYEELEGMLSEMYEKPVLVAASTTLGHFAVLPTIVGEDDVVILDLQVHSSVQMATKLLKAEGIPVHIIRHNDMEKLEDKIKQFRNKYKKIWYFADGVYSMFGDYAPFDKLTELMDTYDQFHVYIDDAHGMSWAGEHGTGLTRSKMEHHDKLVLAVSLNKAFASAGGAFVFPNQEMAQLVKNCGGTMIFCGPIQPPMLGVACESARLHLSDEIYEKQQKLKELIDHCNQEILDSGLPQYEMNNSPVFFIPAGLPRVVHNMVKRLHQEGFYVNSASFPATPMKQGGVRFMMTANLDKEDVTRMIRALRHHYPLALAEEGISFQEVCDYFERPNLLDYMTEHVAVDESEELIGNAFDSINEIEAAAWDTLFAGKGNFTHSGLQLLENTFNENAPEIHDQWDFRYFTVKDAKGNVVLATFFTGALIKDDMFASGAVSKKIEEERKSDPYYLTSKAIMLGCPITKGHHLYMDREHPQWKEALDMLVKELQQMADKHNVSQIMLRDFIGVQDDELRDVMLDLGFSEAELLDTCICSDLSWKDEADYLSKLGKKYRYNVRKEILKYKDEFRLVTTKPETQEEIEEGYNLFCKVYERAFEFNVHKLPLSFFENMNAHEDYDILRLYLKNDPRPVEEQKPVAVMYSFNKGGNYNAMLVGLDYDFVYEFNVYKQILYLTVQRAQELNCEQIDLAYTAVLEKKKVGAKPHPTMAYIQMIDHFNMAVIDSMAASVH